MKKLVCGWFSVKTSNLVKLKCAYKGSGGGGVKILQIITVLGSSSDYGT